MEIQDGNFSFFLQIFTTMAAYIIILIQFQQDYFLDQQA